MQFGGRQTAVATLSSDVATILQAFRKELTLEEVKARMALSGDQKAINHLLDCIVHTHSEEDLPQAKVMEAAY